MWRAEGGTGENKAHTRGLGVIKLFLKDTNQVFHYCYFRDFHFDHQDLFLNNLYDVLGSLEKHREHFKYMYYTVSRNAVK